tara:strand:- start:5995 stop:6573 length:579 start_codon:yes stop_codon:yes gene_type:complete
MTIKSNYFDTTTIILLGLLVLLLVVSIPLFMNNSKINNITRDLDIIETFSNCHNKEYFSTTKDKNPLLKKNHPLKKNPPLKKPPLKKPRLAKNKEGFTNNDDDIKLELYTMNGCGHCMNFKTTWGEIKTHPELGNFAIEIGPTNPDYDKLCSKHSIRGFPHIQLTKNGMKLSEYKGPRSVIDIYNWFNNNVM